MCNNTQHIGLQDDVPDFRLCTRTVILNPFFRFLYWHMNYHIEHHMYAAVPCYRLGKLHATIKNDLPHCPRGLYEAWTEIADYPRATKGRARLRIRAGIAHARRSLRQVPLPASVFLLMLLGR